MFELAPAVRVRDPELAIEPVRLDALEEREPDIERALAIEPLFNTLPEM